MSENRRPQGGIFLTHTVHGTGPHLHTLLMSFVKWQMSRLVSDSVPVHPHQSSLIISRTRLPTDGDRAFPVAAARVWNSLPVTSAPSVAVFRYQFKIKSKSNASLIIRCFIIRCLFATQAEHEYKYRKKLVKTAKRNRQYPGWYL